MVRIQGLGLVWVGVGTTLADDLWLRVNLNEQGAVSAKSLLETGMHCWLPLRPRRHRSIES